MIIGDVDSGGKIWARSNYALRAPLVTRREGFQSAVSSDATRKKGETSPLPSLMPDSPLNGAERALQHSFSKLLIFNGLPMAAAVSLAYLPMRALPDLPKRPNATVELVYRTVALPAATSPLRLAGAWNLRTTDGRFSGLSALAMDGDRFLAVSDRGYVTRFSRPFAAHSTAWLADLREGPRRPWGEIRSRDAESVALDPAGRGWWIGFEQNHSLYLYDRGFKGALAAVDLHREDWSINTGAEGLIVEQGHLLVLRENGREVIKVSGNGMTGLKLAAGADVADAAVAPDGGAWLLLRSKGLGGIRQSIAPLVRTASGYRKGSAMPVPKGAFDNFEGMAIETAPGGGMRFWLITDDGHRFMARTLLVALDYDPPRHDKSPARGAGPSKQRNI